MIAATKDGYMELEQVHIGLQTQDSYCRGVSESTSQSSPWAGDLKSIAGGVFHLLGLKFDGTVRSNSISGNIYGAETIPAGLVNVKEIAAGSFHSLALKTDGTVRAWGRNVDGQCTVPTFPVQPVTAISGGHQHSLALMANGMAFGWGDNTYGQSGPHGFGGLQSISAGRHHNLARTASGTVDAWGANYSGQINVPGGLTNVVAVAAGGEHSLALTSSGSVVAWGRNTEGQCNVPPRLRSVRAITAGEYHSGAVLNPTVDFGNQPVGTPSAQRTFWIKIPGFYNLAPLTISSATLLPGGNNSDFQLDTSTMSTIVTSFTSLKVTFTPSTTGERSVTLRILNDDPDQGTYDILLIGNGQTGPGPWPELAVFNHSTTAAHQERTSSVGLFILPSQYVGDSSDPQVFTIKNQGTANLTVSTSGTTGDFAITAPAQGTVLPGQSTNFSVTFTPTMQGVRNGTITITSNDPQEPTFNIPLNGTGLAVPNGQQIEIEQPAGTQLKRTIVVWGDNTQQQLNTPNTLRDVVAVSAGSFHSAALENDGTVVTWGLSGYPYPAQVPKHVRDIVSLAAGAQHTDAVTKDGTLLVWPSSAFPYWRDIVPGWFPLVKSAAPSWWAPVGSNLAVRADGRAVHDSFYGVDHVPPTVGTVQSVKLGFEFGLGLTTTGFVKAWSHDMNGPPGGTVIEVNAPTTGGFTSIAAGFQHALALRSNGTVAAWGPEYANEVSGTAAWTNVRAIAAGEIHSVGLLDDDTVVAVGTSNYGNIPQVPAALTQVQTSNVQMISAFGIHVLAMQRPVVDFGPSPIGVPVTKTFTIRNPGGLGLAITGGTLTQGNPGDFSRGTLPTGIAAGGSNTFTATFTPTAPGFRRTVLRVLSNDANLGVFEITLQGTGLLIEPDIAVQQDSTSQDLTNCGTPIDFGTSALNTPTSQTFTLCNTGTANLVLGAITFAPTTDFSLSGYTAATLTPGQCTPITVTFKPSALGVRNATLSIASNDPDENPFCIYLNGFGTAPEINVDHPFGTHLTDGVSISVFSTDVCTCVTKTFYVTNTGNGDLHVSSVFINGVNAAEYSFTIQGYPNLPSQTSPISIIPFGGVLSIDVTFCPTSSGAKSAVLHIISDDSDEASFDIKLGGKAAGPEIDVKKSAPSPVVTLADNVGAVDFGCTAPGASSARTLKITNLGNRPLTVTTPITVTGPDAALFTVGTFVAPTNWAYTVAASFPVTFNSSSPGLFSATLLIKSNDCDESTFEINLTACCIGAKADVWLKPAAVGTTQSPDYFGGAIAISGDTLVVGAENENSTSLLGAPANENGTSPYGDGAPGAAYVYVRGKTGWSQQAYLKPAYAGTVQQHDLMGLSVAIDGDTIIVGAPAEDSTTTGVNSVADEGAHHSGAAYIFVRTGSTWTQQAYLKAPFPLSSFGGLFGWSVGISGDTVIVGAIGDDSTSTGVGSTPNHDGFRNGSAFVFTRSGTTWTYQAYLRPSATTIDSSTDYDQFGAAVAIHGDTVIVGAVGESSTSTLGQLANDNGPGSGAAYIFTRSGTVWTQQAYLKPSAYGLSQDGDRFGSSVAIHGDTAIVGAPDEDSDLLFPFAPPDESSPDSGAAYVFVRNGTTWSQQTMLKATDFGISKAGDSFGEAVAISGDIVTVGAVGEDSNTLFGSSAPPDEEAPGSGAAYVFLRTGTAWTQKSYLKPSGVGTTQVGDRFGSAVGVSGSTVVVGAMFEDSDTLGINPKHNEMSPNSGGAYVFGCAGPLTPQLSVFTGATTSTAYQRTSGGSFAFGNTQPLCTSAGQVFTLENTGASLLSGISVTKTGSDAAHFTVTAPATSLAPNVSSAITVKFAPLAGASGPLNAIIDIASGSPVQHFLINVSGNATAGSPAAIASSSIDNIKYIGDSATLSVTATGTNLTYQWKKNGTAIGKSANPGADTPTLTLIGLTSASAGTYSCVVTNPCPPTNSVTATGTLVIVSPYPLGQDVVAGSTATLLSNTRAWGTTTGLVWSKVGSTISGAHYGGITGTTLQRDLSIFATVDPGDEGDYTLSVTSAGGTLVSGPITLRVLVPPVVDPLVWSPLEVSQETGNGIDLPVSAINDPATFTITGLPSGLSYDPTTGEIIGASTVDGTFPISITATNAAGTSAPQTTNLVVTPLPLGLLGTYVGSIPHDPIINDNLGGLATITIASNGMLSGTIKQGTGSYPIVASLGVSNGSYFAYINLNSAGLRLDFTLDLPNRTLSGNASKLGASIPFAAALPTNNPGFYAAAHVSGHTYHFATGLDVGDPNLGNNDVPQGFSYGAFDVVPTTGAVSGIVKLADDSSTKDSTFPINGTIGQDGSIPIFRLLYSNTGSFHGSLLLDTTNGLRLTPSTLGWTKKPQTGTTRYFKSGFGPLDLTAIGSRFAGNTPLSPSPMAMNLPKTTDNAKLVFTYGLAPSPTTRMDVNTTAGARLTVGPTATDGTVPITLPGYATALPSVGSHARISALTLNSHSLVNSTMVPGVTDITTGTFALKDINPFTGLPVTRTNPFRALILNDGIGQRAYGYFLLEELPQTSSETPATTKYRSGRVILGP